MKKKTKAKKATVADHGSETHAVALTGKDGITEEIKTAVATALVKHADGAVESSSEQVAVVQAKAPMANVGVRLGRTINMGNFNNAKIEVSFHAPADMNEDDINQTFDFAINWVNGKMDELVGQMEQNPEDKPE